MRWLATVYIYDLLTIREIWPEPFMQRMPKNSKENSKDPSPPPRRASSQISFFQQSQSWEVWLHQVVKRILNITLHNIVNKWIGIRFETFLTQMRRKRYRPKGELKVVRYVDSSSSWTFQYPHLASIIEKILAPLSFGRIVLLTLI